VQRRYSAKEINLINHLNGYEHIAGFLPIFFSEPWRRNAGGEDILAWGMQGVGTFQIEIDVASSASSPTISGYAVVDNVQQPLQSIIKVRKQTVGVSATGAVTVSTLPKRDVYHRIHCLENTAADIADVEVTIDSLEVYKMDDAENSALLATRGFNEDAKAFHIIFDETQRVEDGIPMAKANNQPIAEFRIDVNMAAANDFTMLVETRGNPD